ncbi:hypothetical protein L3Y34_000980 [Caenorhabditis briggsae]|uniref:STI1 domain-containing protein n=1 Tax=Caenorhabditis briggsae TaxID=6238 RepID=A0AAE9DAR2_CAEBR|nr:hypothetical protein L3Y34_000980 [Caenorhabditis briggsae]
MCQSNPAILHSPEFGFFRDYLVSLGATLPPKPETPAPEGKCPMGGDKKEEKREEKPAEPEIPKPAEIPFPEIDNEGVIEPEEAVALPMGDSNKAPSDEDVEKASEERGKAQEALGNGDFDAALTHFTAAIEANPGSAMLHAKRASVLLKLKRPIAAIADCDKAISINPDSAQGYKFRGRANRLLGKWVEAKTDLATACKLDYDDDANEWLKEVEPNAHKIQEYNRAVERQKTEIELAERRERVRRAQEANRKAAEEEAKRFAEAGGQDEFPGAFPGGFPGGFPGAGGMPGGFPGAGGMPGAGGPGAGMEDLFSDPDIMAAFKDPEVMPALMDIMSNPANIMKYANNPKIASLITKLQSKGAGMPGMFGGAPAGAAGGCQDEHCGGPCGGQQPPRRAPEPDLD